MQQRSLPLPEIRLAVLQELLLRQNTIFGKVALVAVDEFPIHQPCRPLPDGRFSAARHSDQHQIFLLPPQLAADPQHRLRFRHGCTKGIFRRSRLRRQHQKSPACGNAERSRLLVQSGAQGIVDHIGDPKTLREFPQIQRGGIAAGRHSHRSGVNKKEGSAAEPVGKVLIVQLSAAAYHGDLGSPQLRRRSFCGMSRTAAAQNHHRFTGQLPAVLPQQKGKTRQIGIVTGQGAVPLFFQQVDAAAALCRRGKTVAIRQHPLLVGNGHINR